MYKRKELSLQEKYDILKRFDTLPKCSQRNAASLLGMTQPSLSKLLRKRDEIVDEIAKNGNLGRKRKRGGKAVHVEQALLEWYTNASSMGVPLTRTFLLQKAEDIANDFGDTNFVATEGWLSRWKDRYNIVLIKSSERKAVSEKLYESISEKHDSVCRISYVEKIDESISNRHNSESLETENGGCVVPDNNSLAPMNHKTVKPPEFHLENKKVDGKRELAVADDVYNALDVIRDFLKQRGAFLENAEHFYKVEKVVHQLLHS